MTKNKHKTLSMKAQIWRMVMLILFLFLISLTFINSFILQKSKEDFLFSQLQESAEAKRNYEKDEEMITLVNHFLIIQSGDDYSITIDKYTEKFYMKSENGSHILKAISEKVIKDHNQGSYSQGKLNFDNSSYYYYAEYFDDSDNILVFITSVQKSSLVPLSFVIAFLITLVISSIVIKVITSRIVKPIHELELFAENIARHSWDVNLPTSETTEIQQLSDSLDRMRVVLKTTDEREQQFLQSSSHNLKTPVMVIKGYAQAMIDGMLVDNSVSPAQVIQNEAENLERRISQLLKLNTYGYTLDIENKQDSIRIDRLLNSLIRRFEIVRPDLRWNVKVQPLEIKGNGEALLTAFENLIENQLRYAKSLIEISTIEDSKESLVIQISNDGPQFNQEDPMCLFDRYKKDEAGQWGLGLTIVKQIIDAHNGKVFAQNTKEGVEFVVTLPK